MEALTRYGWPGNVRQLENWIENAVIFVDGGRIDLEHFPALRSQPLDTPAAALPRGLTLPELERLYIVDTLRRTGGHRTRAAAALGISLRTLQYRLRDYGINLARASAGPAEGGRASARAAVASSARAE
jgi:two-component system, NtrC family, response regulator HydG